MNQNIPWNRVLCAIVFVALGVFTLIAGRHLTLGFTLVVIGAAFAISMFAAPYGEGSR